ncbi:hypothetical protein D3874_13695 [Oleomonas cavernae]|uniref:T2SS protein K first SAM-like domain-containing protein n=1 Tax=Oleomonas cavernae TaxID=2320859 RepID=A0A418WD48_9PROT|nr:type II secretion system protein GspK [Oleomonas cavernae]RJF87943.1 hypothetical protein D3874_13695 [Oleomonas cavernae]
MNPKGTRQRGFALPAAVAGIGIFALVAVSILEWGRGTTALLRGQASQARLEAAADAGLMLAIHGLGIDDRARRWPIGGPPRTLGFDGVAVTVTVEDERGKVPINAVDTEIIRALLAHAGADGQKLDELTDAVEDWIDEDDRPRLHGAEREDYAARGIVPRNGGFRSVDEIALVRGMDPAIFAAIAPLVTLVPRADVGVIDGRHASAAVLEIMAGTGPDSIALIGRQREEQGQQVAIALPDNEPLALQLVTIRVSARLGPDAGLTRATIVEFTGDRRRPYWIRSYR